MYLKNSYPDRESSMLVGFIVYLVTTEGLIWLRFLFVAMAIRWYLGALTVDQLLKEIIYPDGLLLHQTIPTIAWKKFWSLLNYRTGKTKTNKKKQNQRSLSSPVIIYIQTSHRSRIDSLLSKIVSKLGKDLMKVTHFCEFVWSLLKTIWFCLMELANPYFIEIGSYISEIWLEEQSSTTEHGIQTALHEMIKMRSEHMTSHESKAKPLQNRAFPPQNNKKRKTKNKVIQANVVIPENEKNFNFPCEENRLKEYQCFGIPDNVRAKYKELREEILWAEKGTKMSFGEFSAFLLKLDKTFIGFDFKDEKNSIMKEELNCFKEQDEVTFAAFSTVAMTWYYLYIMDGRDEYSSMFDQIEDEALLVKSVEDGFQGLLAGMREALREELEERKCEEEEKKRKEVEEKRIKMEFKSFLSGDFDGVGIIEVPVDELELDNNNINLENELMFLEEMDYLQISQPNEKINNTINTGQVWKRNKKIKSKRRR